VDDNEALVVDHTDGNQPYLAICLAVGEPCQYLGLEDEGGIQHVDATLLDDLPTLVFVPFENQGRPPFPKSDGPYGYQMYI
jgi:hypothetical protein